LSAQAHVFLEKLGKLSTGERAILKRNAGNRLAEARGGAMGLFYNRVFPYNARDRDEDWYFLVATLYPLEKDSPHSYLPGSFGGSLRQVRTGENENGLNRRMERLLDADEQQLHFFLRQAVHYIASQRGRINWGRLLQDLLNWSHPERWVQRRWARDYFTNQPNP
jgi:CRISPR system Cascade subunit CasB